MKEYILCSAIWFDDGTDPGPHAPKGITSGLVLCGWRHHSIFSQIYHLLGNVGDRRKLDIEEREQGFITNQNRFVTREEAAEIAYQSGQIKEKKDSLYSEDVW